MADGSLLRRSKQRSGLATGCRLFVSPEPHPRDGRGISGSCGTGGYRGEFVTAAATLERLSAAGTIVTVAINLALGLVIVLLKALVSH